MWTNGSIGIMPYDCVVHLVHRLRYSRREAKEKGKTVNEEDDVSLVKKRLQSSFGILFYGKLILVKHTITRALSCSNARRG